MVGHLSALVCFEWTALAFICGLVLVCNTGVVHASELDVFPRRQICFPIHVLSCAFLGTFLALICAFLGLFLPRVLEFSFFSWWQ